MDKNIKIKQGQEFNGIEIKKLNKDKNIMELRLSKQGRGSTNLKTKLIKVGNEHLKSHFLNKILFQ